MVGNSQPPALTRSQPWTVRGGATHHGQARVQQQFSPRQAMASGPLLPADTACEASRAQCPEEGQLPGVPGDSQWLNLANLPSGFSQRLLPDIFLLWLH